MNAVERCQAVLDGEATDRRMVSLTLSLYGAKLINCPLDRYYTDAAAYAEGQLAVRDTFNPDVLLSPFALTAEGEAFGSRIRFYPTQAPNITHPAVASADGLADLPCPDVGQSPPLQFIREAVRRMARGHGAKVPIAGIVTAPGDLPTLILGVEAWLNTLLFDGDGARRLLDAIRPFFTQWANALLDDGATFLVLPSGFTSPDMSTPAVRNTITLPALKEALSEVRGPVILHHAGARMVPALESYADLPNVIGFVLEHRDNILDARRIVGPDKLLLGGICGPTLDQESPSALRDRCRAILRESRDDPRFILATTAADIPWKTPEEHIQTIRRSAEEFAEEVRSA